MLIHAILGKNGEIYGVQICVIGDQGINLS